MSEYFPTSDTDDSENLLTIELSNTESFVMSPHNTALFEFTGQAASRDHVFFYTSTDAGDLAAVYLFRTFDPDTYGLIRQRILTDPAYETMRSDEVDPCEERAYQQQVDREVDAWRRSIPDTAIELLITTAA